MIIIYDKVCAVSISVVNLGSEYKAVWLQVVAGGTELALAGAVEKVCVCFEAPVATGSAVVIAIQGLYMATSRY